MINFHFHEQRTPSKNEVTMVRVTKTGNKTTTLSVNVELLEYNNIDGIIPMSEMFRGKTRKTKMSSEGEIFPAYVADIESNIVVLSKTKVDKTIIKNYMNRYNYLKHLMNLATTIFRLYNKYYKIDENDDNLQNILEHSLWRLQDEEYDDIENSNYEELYTDILKNINCLFDSYYEQEFIDYACNFINKRITYEDAIVYQKINLISYNKNAPGEIKQILDIKLDNDLNNQVKYEIKILSPPTYLLEVSSINMDAIIEIIGKVKEQIDKNITRGTKCSYHELEIVKNNTVKLNSITEHDVINA